MESYAPEAFTVALEATSSRWKQFVEWILKLLKETTAKILAWFRAFFYGSIEKAHDNLDHAIERLEHVNEAVSNQDDIAKGLAQEEVSPAEQVELKRDAFVKTFESGIGACIVKLQFKEELWLRLFMQHINMCVHITEEVTDQDDIISAILEKRKAMKGQIANDVRKTGIARNALEKALGLKQTNARTLIECIQADTTLFHLIEQSTDVRINPQFLLTNVQAVAKMMAAMDSDEYRANAERDVDLSSRRLELIDAGIAKLEAQLKSQEGLARQEESALLREYISELNAAIVGLQRASHFHIKYVNAHTRIILAFTDYYHAAAAVVAAKQSPAAFAKFNSDLKK